MRNFKYLWMTLLLAASLGILSPPAMGGDDRDDPYYDKLRDQIYEDDWSDDLCGRVEAFHIYIGGLHEKLGLIDAQIALKEQQLAEAGNNSTRRSLERQLQNLAEDRVVMMALIQQTNADAAEASIAQDGTACDTPNLYYVGADLEPFVHELPGSYGPDPRPLASVRDASGRTGHFFSNEVVVDSLIAADVAARWNGSVMAELPPSLPGEPALALVVVDTGGADPAAFPGLEAQLTDSRGAVIEVSSEAGLALLTVAASEAAAGNMVGINWIARPDGYEDGVLTEDADGPGGWTDLPDSRWSDNPYDWNHLRAGSELNLGIVEAWTLLDEAGKLDNKIGLGILDGGFYPGVNGDFPTGFRNFSVVGGTAPLNTSGLDPARPDHGTPVLNTAAAAADNGAGVIGTGSPVADTIAIFTGYDLFHTIVALDQGRIAGVRVANMSYGGWLPTGLEWSLAPFELAFVNLSESLVLVTSAGNAGDNNDNEVCLGDLCWETGVNWPCELSNAFCVGGIQTLQCNDPMGVGRCGGAESLSPRQKAPGSNFGKLPDDDISKGHPGEDTVDTYAPYRVVVGPRPSNTSGVHLIQGTSFSAPYVAGLAALVWAADPAQTARDVMLTVHFRGKIPRDDAGVRDPEVKVIVDPLDSVSWTLNQVCPCISIKHPENGATYDEGDAIVPRATMYRAGADLVSAEWTVFYNDTSGTVEATRSGMTAPLVPVVGGGRHVYQLAATFSNGDTVTETVTVNYTNTPPLVELLSPLSGATLTDNESVRLRARATDAGYPAGLPDANVKWYLDDSLIPIATGKDTTVSFAGRDLGFHTLTVEASDGFASDSDWIGFTLEAGGPNSPPTIEISSPVDGDVISGTPDGVEWYTHVDLQAVASDPDPADILQVDWFISKDGGALQYLGSGSQILNTELRIQSCFGSTFAITAIVTDGINPNRSDTVVIVVRGSDIC